ncbi:Mbeg1-like protein [Bacillus toyonensis]|uniref:Mbeg1-like protein n=1 Tax=Bacillus toyonensis TaxID=155322 RepID=UPI003466064F
MKKKAVLVLAFTSFISLGQIIPDVKVFAEETQFVKQKQNTIQKELQSSWNGNITDPDKEIQLQPGETAPLPNWIKEVEKNNNKHIQKFGLTAGNTSFVNQLVYMSKHTYDNDPIGTWSQGEWQLYRKYTDPDSSFTCHVYRKKYIEESDTGLYGYTFVFKGTQEGKDWINDIAQIGANVGGLQAAQAEKYVNDIISSDRSLIHHVYFTGHSLGGYLAQWIQSEMVDGNMINGYSYTMTFNAPGFSQNLVPMNSEYKSKVRNKIKRDKEYVYDSYIDNYRITEDLVSLWGDNLGKVHHYGTKSLGGPFHLHSLDRILELDL